jgi:heptosyltransferase III
MEGKVAVFACKGLGDGLISLILAHNLRKSGKEVLVYHPFLGQMASWFPKYFFEKISEEDDWEKKFSQMEHLFFFYEDSARIRPLIRLAMQYYPQKTTILNPIATKNKDYPYWAHAKFNGSCSLVENLEVFCKTILHLEIVERKNGILPPSRLIKNRYPHRIVIHPSSSREGKNWPKEKFAILSCRLRKSGFDPVFIVSKEEASLFSGVLENLQSFSNLSEMAAFIYESGYMIGNDSGIGHLASCLGIPTVTICRSIRSITFWRPDFSQGVIVSPSLWIPNPKSFRMRDKFWKRWISVGSVEKGVKSLIVI